MATTRKPPRLSTLIFLSALSVLPVNMILPSLPDIAGTFGAPYWLINLSVAGHAIAAAAAQVIGGALVDRYGRRSVALASIALFIIASMGCALAPGIGLFLLCRALQAPVILCYSVALALIKESAGEREAASKIGYVSIAWAIAPLCGPGFGGALDGLFGWRAGFIALAILGAVLFLLAMLDLGDGHRPMTRAATCSFGGYGQLLRSPRFRAYTLCMIFSIGTLYIFLGGAPLAAGKADGLSDARLGFYMGLVPAGFILGSYLAGRHAARHALATGVVIGRLIACAGLLAGLLLILAGVAHAAAFFGSCVFIGIGNGLSMAGANAGVLAVRADRPDAAATLAPALTTGGGVSVAAIAGLLLTPENAAYALHAMMLASAFGALAAALHAASVDRRATRLAEVA